MFSDNQFVNFYGTCEYYFHEEILSLLILYVINDFKSGLALQYIISFLNNLFYYLNIFHINILLSSNKLQSGNIQLTNLQNRLTQFAYFVNQMLRLEQTHDYQNQYLLIYGEISYRGIIDKGFIYLHLLNIISKKFQHELTLAALHNKF
ncbi:hypothetical protein pb186bvf_017212 [Paramecium bursaria]